MPILTTKSQGPMKVRHDSVSSAGSGLPVLGVLMAEYDYTALSPKDLSFKKGDQISILKIKDNN